MHLKPMKSKFHSVLLPVLFLTLLLSRTGAATDDAAAKLLFHLPFEGNLTPVVAGNQTESSVSGTAKVRLTYGEGVKGKALLAGMNDLFISFPMSGNIEPREGTVALWVKPLDWDPAKEELMAMHTFFELVSATDYVLLYKYTGAVKLLIKNGDKTWVIDWWPTEWKTGEWRHFAFTWKDGRHRYYVNGKLVGEMVDVRWSPDLKTMWVASGSSTGKPDPASTAFDEVRIFNRSLSEGEIQTLLARDRNQTNPPELTIPLSGPSEMKLDGVLQPDEWKNSAEYTGFITIFTQRWDRQQPRIWLQADRERLYIAWQWEHGSEPISQDKIGRDSAVYLDDSIEVWLDPHGAGDPAKLVQCIVNARGSIYDSQGGNPAWNGNWTCCCRDDEGRWTAELSVPWSDLGGLPAVGERWGLNICRNRAGGTGGSSSLSYAAKGQFAAASTFARVRLLEDVPMVQIESFGLLEYGKIDLRLTLRNPAREPRPVTVRLTGRSNDGTLDHENALLEKTIILAPGAAEPVTLDRLLQDSTVRELALQVTDQRTHDCLYRAELPVTVSTDYEISYSPRPGRNIFSVTVDPLYTPLFSTAKSVNVQIRGKGAATSALTATTQVQTGRQSTVEFREDKIPAGDNEIVVSVKDAAAGELQRIVPFYRPQRPAAWETQRPGLEPGVPPPWTPVTCHGGTLSLWGRTIRFGNELLPLAMTSQEKPLLSGPMTLVASMDGKPLAVNGLPFTVTNTDAEGIDLATRAAAGPLALTTKTRTEFDGVMRIELTLTAPQKGLMLDELTLHLPMPANIATQYAWGGQYAMIPDGQTVLGRSTHLWVGNDDVGLCWFAEGFPGWNLKDGNQGVVLQRSASGVELQIRIIDTPTRLAEPLSITFGLLATPVKPLPTDWHVRDFQGYNPPIYKERGFQEEEYAREQYSFLVGTEVFFDPMLITWRKPDGTLPVRDDLAEWRRKGHNWVAWSQFTSVGRNLPPDYRYYGEEWRIFPSGASWQGAGGSALMMVCPKSGWGNCLVKGVETMAKVGFNGQYFDTGVLSPCRNPLHGCGYTARDGQPERTLPFFAAREVKKRMYKILYHEFGVKGEPFYISTLCNGDLQWPLLTFDTAAVSGEEWNGRLAADLDYTKILTLPEWRVKFWPNKWGFIHIPLPSVADPNSWTSQTAFETFTLFRLSAGTPLWPCQNGTMYTKLWRAQRDFGVENAPEFHPFWNSAAYITVSGKDTAIAFYRKGNELLISASNLAGNPIDESLNLHLDQLKLAGSVNTAVDTFRDEPVTIQGNTLRCTIGAKNFRLIRVKCM